MEPEEALLQEAAWITRSMQGTEPNLSTELRIRLNAYQPRMGRHLMCPACWIRHDRRNTLRSLPGTNTEDVLKCNFDPCGAEFVVPL